MGMTNTAIIVHLVLKSAWNEVGIEPILREVDPAKNIPALYEDLQLTVFGKLRGKLFLITTL